MSRRARAVAVLVAATPVLSVLAPWGAPATAATCGAGGGVSVVVDYHGLGPGGVSTGCVAGGGGDTASALFAAAGHELTRAQRQPGFVCRVDAVPADDPCVNTSPASAYWGLWWSDGESGEWTYSSLGVDSLEVPDGGSVAFSWDDVEGSAPPGATPPQAAPSAAPSGGTGGSGGGTSGGSGTTALTGSGAPTAAATDGADDADDGDDEAGIDGGATRREARQERDGRADRTRDEAGRDGSDEEDATASASPTGAAEVTADPAPVSAQDDAGDGLPVWVAPVAVLVLAAGAGVTVLLRRRSTP